jgi:hypothetical protein
MRRRVVVGHRVRLLLLFALVAVGCAPAAQQAAPANEGDTPAADATDADESPPFFWELPADQLDDVEHSVPLSDIISGGPPPDGIPPIDEPAYETIAQADEWLEDREPVMVVRRDGAARAYPLRLLTYHEIVNDTLGGAPLLVTYCPLCNSGLAFDPVVDGRTLDFGTSGRLLYSNLVMYDRATHSLWQQFTGEGIVGEYTGAELERIPAAIVAWEDYKAADADGDVLSRETGHARPYGTNPYVGYDSASTPFLFDGPTGGPLPQIARVVAFGGEQDPIAVPLDVLREQRVVATGDAVVLWTPGTASALDAAEVAGGADVGASGVFDATVDGQALTFTADGDDAFVDAQTDSRWTILGEAVDGPLAGKRLERLEHDDTFWFVQYAFRPETRVVEG